MEGWEGSDETRDEAGRYRHRHKHRRRRRRRRRRRNAVHTLHFPPPPRAQGRGRDVSRTRTGLVLRHSQVGRAGRCKSRVVMVVVVHQIPYQGAPWPSRRSPHSTLGPNEVSGGSILTDRSPTQPGEASIEFSLLASFCLKSLFFFSFILFFFCVVFMLSDTVYLAPFHFFLVVFFPLKLPAKQTW